MVVPIINTNFQFSEKFTKRPQNSHKTTVENAVIIAALLPVALVIRDENFSKKLANFRLASICFGPVGIINNLVFNGIKISYPEKSG